MNEYSHCLMFNNGLSCSCSLPDTCQQWENLFSAAFSADMSLAYYRTAIRGHQEALSRFTIEQSEDSSGHQEKRHSLKIETVVRNWMCVHAQVSPLRTRTRTSFWRRHRAIASRARSAARKLPESPLPRWALPPQSVSLLYTERACVCVVYNLVQCCAWLLKGDGPVSEGFSLRQHGCFFW